MFRHLPALAQLVGDGFEARCRFGGGFHVVVDLGGLLHGLAAHREAGVVPPCATFSDGNYRLVTSWRQYLGPEKVAHGIINYPRGDGGGHCVDVGEFSEERLHSVCNFSEDYPLQYQHITQKVAHGGTSFLNSPVLNVAGRISG